MAGIPPTNGAYKVRDLNMRSCLGHCVGLITCCSLCACVSPARRAQAPYKAQTHEAMHARQCEFM
eukprot:366021-Chlamydomonas_euryale.AAC.9